MNMNMNINIKMRTYKYAWTAFNRLRHYFSHSILTSWDEVRTGILSQSEKSFSQLEIEWNSKSFCVLSKKIPWKLLTSSILWNIWVAKTQKEIGEESFHLESILFKS